MPEKSFDATPRTRLRRAPIRGSYDRKLIYQILDEAMICHVGFLDHHQPYVIPMNYARRDNSLILHGSVESRLMNQLASGARVCVTVTLLDGLVLARSQFHHSMNYRSVVALGVARSILTQEEKKEAFEHFMKHLIPGREKDSRPPHPGELAVTAVLEFPLTEVSAKTRSGPPVDAQEDLSFPAWAGVIPFRLEPGEPEPDPTLAPGKKIPKYVSKYRRKTPR